MLHLREEFASRRTLEVYATDTAVRRLQSVPLSLPPIPTSHHLHLCNGQPINRKTAESSDQLRKSIVAERSTRSLELERLPVPHLGAGMCNTLGPAFPPEVRADGHLV